MSFIDTHSHLYLPEFADDIDAVVKRALQNDVRTILLPNIDSDSIDPLKKLCSKYPDVFKPMMGLHPTSVEPDFREQIGNIQEELSTGNYIAIGEIGIDLYWDKTFYKEQVQAFEMQIDIALQNDLPIVVHARDSFSEILDVLEKYKNSGLRGVLHSFTGTREHAERALKLDFYLGVGGISTFKNAGIGEIIADQPLEKLILETDSPYLAPTPMRGKRNESAYIPYIAKKLAENKNLTVEAVKQATTINAKNLFKL